ncbi:MAG: UDP-3-O-acyl-N-acetylglucosamine deacetylase [Desulfobacterales bacterium]|nr:UDP-3-O-acyl-N-acetylglucosamine deacetylase [Desulfobacterales bacterium]
MTDYILQKTLGKPISFSGVGVHSGKLANITIKPAEPNHGIKFKRVDVAEHIFINARFNAVIDTSLATVIGNDGVIVSTIEHLMASFAGLSIDNAVVEIDSYEMPIIDGSAALYTEKILSAGIVTQDSPKMFFVVLEPIRLEQGDKYVVVYPNHEFKLTCTIVYNHPLIQVQTYTCVINDENFINEISKARTFGFLHEIQMLKQYGLGRGGSLDNAVVIDKESVLNPGGLRYPDEFVRHKMLDCLGDFSLLGMPILGHIVTYKSGHAFNHAFLEQFFLEKQSWETRAISVDYGRV